MMLLQVLSLAVSLFWTLKDFFILLYALHGGRLSLILPELSLKDQYTLSSLYQSLSKNLRSASFENCRQYSQKEIQGTIMEIRSA